MDHAQLNKALDNLLAQLGSAGDLNTSAVLYGSAARGDWIPGRSDVNLMLVVDDASPESLRRLTPAITDWHKAGFTPPLIIGRSEWARAADVFPIEITDMQLTHRTLCGVDPVADMVVDHDDLRRALETALRGKMVRLRQAYVRFGEVKVTLGGFAAASVAELLVLLRCTAVLLGRKPGREAQETVAALASELGPDAPIVVEIAGHRRDKEWSCSAEEFVRYLGVVQRAVELVDNNQRGDR